MSFVLWQREQGVSVGSRRVVLQASEVPLFSNAQQMCEKIARLRNEQQQLSAAAFEQARAEGHQRGLEEGRQAARDELAAALQAAAQESVRERDRLRTEVAALALHVARKLMGEFGADERLAALAVTAARDMLPAPSITLLVHPEQYEAVRARLDLMAGRQEPPAPQFDVRSDAACAIDACRLETDYGSVDAALEAQLQRLAVAWGLDDKAVA